MSFSSHPLKARLQQHINQIPNARHSYNRIGKLQKVVGQTLEVSGLEAKIGDRCKVMLSQPNNGHDFIYAEVVGFKQQSLYLAPFTFVTGLGEGLPVTVDNEHTGLPVGSGLLGRVITPLGEPLDGKGPLKGALKYRPLNAESPNPMQRGRIEEVLDVGIRAINGLFSVGIGQRIGIMAGSGVGKSVLLSMMTRYTQSDIVVIGLIGERGREIREFIEEELGEEGLKKAAVIACPADQPALLRAQAAQAATTLAEYYRDQGKNVLLLMDSVTRYAQALRETALSIGEVPGTKGYPPSVFANLAKLLERTGPGEAGKGSITAFYTVLADGDDQNDPVVDNTRAIIDGHLVLSRDNAAEGIYPAIDIGYSISRLMNHLVAPEQRIHAEQFRGLWNSYDRQKDMINIGVYQKGNDPQLDKALALREQMLEYVKQDMNQRVSYQDSVKGLGQLLKG